MDAKHTPGPWDFRPGHREIIAPQVVVLDDDGACGDPECCGPATYTIVIKPEDGRLIVQAPRLLHVLQRILEVVDVRIDDPRAERFAAARKVVADATGA